MWDRKGKVLQSLQLHVCACKRFLAFTTLSFAYFDIFETHKILSPAGNETTLTSKGLHCCTEEWYYQHFVHKQNFDNYLPDE